MNEDVGSGSNVDVGSESSIEVRGASPSFDDLEAISVKKPGESPDSVGKKDALENKETKSDNTSKQKVHKESEKPGATKEAGTDTDISEAVKYIKAKHNEAELELATDTMIPTKVAGKLENPTLSELQANYSGKINWDRKYSELSRERTDFDGQVTQLNTMIGQMLEASKDDPFKFFDVVAEATGQDSIKMKMDAIDQQIAMVNKIAHMSPDEIKSWKHNMLMGFKEDSINYREKKLREVDEAKARDNTYSEVGKKYNIEPEKFSEAMKVAKEYVTDREVTADDAVLVDRHFMVLEAIESVNPALAERGDFNDIVAAVRREAIENPGYTGKDVLDIVEGMFGNGRVQRLAKKMKESESAGRGMVRTPDNKNKVLYSFDQLD